MYNHVLSCSYHIEQLIYRDGKCRHVWMYIILATVRQTRVDRPTQHCRYCFSPYYFTIIFNATVPTISVCRHTPAWCMQGALGRFINHSCEPNCETQKWVVQGSEIAIGLFTSKAIPANTELTFDYNFERYGDKVAICLRSMLKHASADVACYLYSMSCTCIACHMRYVRSQLLLAEPQLLVAVCWDAHTHMISCMPKLRAGWLCHSSVLLKTCQPG